MAKVLYYFEAKSGVVTHRRDNAPPYPVRHGSGSLAGGRMRMHRENCIADGPYATLTDYLVTNQSHLPSCGGCVTLKGKTAIVVDVPTLRYRGAWVYAV